MTRLRATRANPPGLAATDEERKETYGAAVQQFDELLLAASTVSPISRPLPQRPGLVVQAIHDLVERCR
jgi:hypothetical protein